MNKQVIALIAMIIAVSVVTTMTTASAYAAKPSKDATIQGGTISDSTGEVITTGFDDWGYNYQARLFNGNYCDSYRDAAWCQPYKDVDLSMKWNDAWLSNTDRDDDGLLDRHYGSSGYIGSGAWLTNHQSGSYELDGKVIQWNYFVKIVAAPSDAISTGGIWYTAGGTEIGPAIWGAFAIVQEIENDPGSDTHGAQFISPLRSGLGNW
ncbi:MAG: hypothetical protein HQ477_13645 [Chloroflexi bacterium]|nr:hypothetical protein [Chloroflexota bacterium]